LSASRPSDLDANGFRALALSRLAQELPVTDLGFQPVKAGDFALNGPAPGADALALARPAAVLAPIVARPDRLTVLLTLRASHLRAHSGQIAFPGGQIDPGETPLQAALRETNEEIGLDERFIEPLGWLDPYLTGTGFRVAPLVALIDPSFALNINRLEVDEAFETPFSFLMNPANHRLEQREWQGRQRRFYVMMFENRYIWGATAGILHNLYLRLFS
jgi:8-oxo-dGTP pyrophosphatase MutT (NUDIX family)